MISRRQPQPESIPPTLTPYQAIERIKKQLSKIDQIISLRRDDPQIEGWISTTVAVLDAAFGKPNDRTYQFLDTSHSYYSGMPDSVLQKYHVQDCEKRRALLQAFIEQLDILAPPAAGTAPDRYHFHPEIERVSGQLFRDGHYKQASLEAYIRVIEAVREKSKLPLDGDDLMNQAFGCDRHAPVIRFNSLQSDAERDEQRGLMFLYKGIVGLRNSKAHSNRLFDDPLRGHEYLALASCLMRVLEIAEV